MANKENLKNWKKGQSGNPKGRPKKIENVLRDIFLDEHNFKLSKNQVDEIIISILSKTKSELTEASNNDDLPFWVALIVNKAKEDYKNGSIDIVEKLLDRVYGSKKTIKHIGGDKEDNPIKTVKKTIISWKK